MIINEETSARNKLPDILRQFLKFGLVGLSNTLISLGIYYALVALQIGYILANTLAFIISVLNAYYWNNRFVFRKTSAGWICPLLRTYLAYGGTFLLSTGLLFIMVRYMGISKYAAPLINLAVTVPLNFLANKFWAFK